MFAFELGFLKWLEGLRTSFLNVFFEGIFSSIQKLPW